MRDDRFLSAPSILVGLLLLSLPLVTRAETRGALDRGIALVADADFDGALRAFAEAELVLLSRDELIALYAHRALAAFAIGRTELVEQDLARLLALGADASLPESAPPEIREQLERLRRDGVCPPRIESSAAVADGRARIDVVTTGGADLVRTVRVWVRGRDEAWRAERAPLEVDIDEEIAWYVEVLGPSETLLATDGTRDAPNLVRAPQRPFLLQHPMESDALLWSLAAGGAIALTAAVVIAVTVATARLRERTQLSGPTLDLRNGGA